MAVLATCGSYVLYETEDRLVFAQRGGQASAGPTFAVACFVAVAAALNGLGLLAAAFHGQAPVAIAFVLLGVALIAGRTASRARRRARARAAPGPDGLHVTLQIDRRTQQLLDGIGKPLAPLNTVQVRRSFQVLSSSKALEVGHAHGSVVVARGNPFFASVEEMADALERKGLSVH